MANKSGTSRGERASKEGKGKEVAVEMRSLEEGLSSIFRVPSWIVRLTGRDVYLPCTFSFGPFHHSNPNLSEDYNIGMKEHMAQAYMSHSGKTVSDFFQAISEVAVKLKKFYHNFDFRSDEERRAFERMMVIDGCFLLEAADRYKKRCRATSSAEAKNLPGFDSPTMTNNPYQVIRALRNDMIAIENQIPLLVLQQLESTRLGAWQEPRVINKLVLELLGRNDLHGFSQLALHPLHLLHASYCGPTQETEARVDKLSSFMPCAVELRKAAVKFEVSSTESFSGVAFETSHGKGVLKLPLLHVHGDMKEHLNNMLALERLYSPIGDQLMSFLYFMNNLINTGKDVSRLRESDVLTHQYGSDDEVANLFNSMQGLVLQNHSELHTVQARVNAHCHTYLSKFLATLSPYFDKPWSGMGFFGAVIELACSIIQARFSFKS